MKVINTNQSVTVPDEVDVSVKSRVVTVKGSRGTLVKSFKHLAVDISMPDKKTVRVEKWFGKKKELAAVRTVCSHITNLMNGVTKVNSLSTAIVLTNFVNITFASILRRLEKTLEFLAVLCNVIEVYFFHLTSFF